MSINYKTQKGASLIMVMAIMIVIALMIIATSKSTNVETRTSFDDTDKKASHMLAETSLVLAEHAADEYYKEHSDKIRTDITANKIAYYPEGLTAKMNTDNNKNKQAWEVEDVFNGEIIAQKQIIEHNSAQAPLFIVEYFGEDFVRARVTVKSWGKAENNSTMLQSIIELSNPN